MLKPIYYALAALDNAYSLEAKNCGFDNAEDMRLCKAKIYAMVAKGAYPVSCNEILDGNAIEIEFESQENGGEGSLIFECPESVSIAQEFYDIYATLDESNIYYACR